MKCPSCGITISIIDTEEVEPYKIIKERECGKCDRIYTTKEIFAQEEIEVKTYTGELEPFDRKNIEEDLINIGMEQKKTKKISEEVEKEIQKWSKINETPFVPWEKIAKVTKDKIENENLKEEYKSSIADRLFQE